MPEEKTKQSYTAENIKVLDGLEGVRKRPSMYIGSTSKDGLHHLVYEVIDNAVDEHLAGACTEIKISVNEDGSVTVIDNGRGIPVDIHPIYKKPALEITITKLHAGGKFDSKAYTVSGGLHGVGISVVAALSKKMIVEVKRDGKIYMQDYNIGKPLHDVKVIGKCEKEETGTKVTFLPDDSIFSVLKFDDDILISRLREIAFLNAGLKIDYENKISKRKEKFNFVGGLQEFVKWLNKTKNPIHSKPIFFEKKVDSTVISVAIQYTEGYQERVFGFVNTINTIEGGTHVTGFKTALTRVINDYADKTLKSDTKLEGDDAREGITAIISIRIREPQFEGQTKTKLGNSEVKGFVDSVVTEQLGQFFEENPSIARVITNKVINAAKARSAAKKARDLVRRKGALSSGALPGKLADCSSKKLDKTELFLVEGESAAGCFSEDTKVALADGRNLSFKELVKEHEKGKENFCYTIKEDGSIGIEKIENPRITKKNSQVIKIILDNNEGIMCTPDHKFMLRNGLYKEAKDLTKEDSLMPLHRRISKIGGRITIEGYEMIWDPKKAWIFTHMLADEYNLKNNIYQKEQGCARHHINFNKRNNNPENIIRMSKEEHLILHTKILEKTMHSEAVKEKARLAHQTDEYRKKMSEWAKQPEVNKMISENSKKLWQNPEYKKFMTKKFKEFYNNNEKYRKKNNETLNEQQRKYWANEENRKKAAEKVKKFFEENPDAKEYLSNLAKEQWKDEMLILWRRQKTKEQWTPEFRIKRKKAYNQTYYEKTIKLMKRILEQNGNLDNFDKIRIESNDKSILSMPTFCKRFFDNNKEKMIESVKYFNHKIKKVQLLDERIDVYDLEVPETHNFALASGIFVHNSSKMARNKEFQAILPLKGKILNVEKANPHKIFENEEISLLASALGTGIGEHFNFDKLRYGKIIIMCDADVDGSHIKTLLLTFFYRFAQKLIESKRIFVAIPPLYKIRKGSQDYYVYSDDELKKITSKLGGNLNVQRFKGLGEMNPQQLWDTTMNPKARALKLILIEDAIEADEIFSTLMGEAVEPRKQFIIEHAKNANLDI
jgi:DNA gyrase subunit B